MATTETTKIIKIVVEGNQAKATMDGVTLSTKELNAELKKVEANARGASAATGGATATVLELGRTVSDSNYGIRGMANNLSQLASNLVFTTRAAGGLGAGLKSIWSAIMGPLGLILAFQAAIALLERMAMTSEKASDSFNDVYGKSVNETVAKLMVLQKTIQSTQLTLEEKQHILGTAKEEMADLGIEVDETATNFESLEKALEKNIKIMMKTAVAQGFLNVFQESANEFAKEQMKTTEEALSGWDNFLIEWGGMYSYRSEIQAEKEEKAQENREEAMSKHNNKMTAAFEELQKTLEDGDRLLDYVFGTGDEKQKSKRTRALKIFKQGIFDVESVIRNSYKSLMIAETDNEIEKLKIQRNFAEQAIHDKYEQFEERQKIRLQDYLASIKGHEREAQLAAEANAKFEQSMTDAAQQRTDAVLAIQSNYAQKILDKEEEIFDKTKTMEFDFRREYLDSRALFFDEARIQASEANNKILEEEIAHREEMAALLTDSLARLEAENEIAMMRMQLKEQELDHEIMIINARKNINSEYLSFMQGIGSALAAASQQGSALATAALVIQKGAAIASIVVEAQRSIAEATTATGSANQKVVDFYAPMGFMGLAPMAAQIAANTSMLAANNARTKIGAGISIANILATTIGGNKNIKGTSTSTAGGGGVGGGRTFDFNLVGTTGTNQLAEAVGAQFQEPIQAFVVSSQMTSQQELDLEISTGASLGD